MNNIVSSTVKFISVNLVSVSSAVKSLNIGSKTASEPGVANHGQKLLDIQVLRVKALNGVLGVCFGSEDGRSGRLFKLLLEFSE